MLIKKVAEETIRRSKRPRWPKNPKMNSGIIGPPIHATKNHHHHPPTPKGRNGLTSINITQNHLMELGIHKDVGRFWENHVLPEVGPKVKVFPNSCFTHALINGIRQIRHLRWVTMRFFSMCSLFSVSNVEKRLVQRAEHIVDTDCRCAWTG